MSGIQYKHNTKVSIPSVIWYPKQALLSLQLDVKQTYLPYKDATAPGQPKLDRSEVKLYVCNYYFFYVWEFCYFLQWPGKISYGRVGR